MRETNQGGFRPVVVWCGSILLIDFLLSRPLTLPQTMGGEDPSEGSVGECVCAEGGVG